MNSSIMWRKFTSVDFAVAGKSLVSFLELFLRMSVYDKNRKKVLGGAGILSL